MKKRMLTILSLLLFGFATWAQTDNQLGNVSNVDWTYDSDEEKITITYDLARIGVDKYFNISISAILDGQPLTPSKEALKGDIGEFIRAGLGKKIVWDATQDIVFTEDASLKFRITAVAPPKPTEEGGATYIPTEPQIFIPIGAGVLGGGLMIAGFGAQNSDDVKAYEDRCATASVSDLTPGSNGQSPCDVLFEEAEKDHNRGNLMIITGLGVIVAGGALYIKQLLDYNNAIQLNQSGNDSFGLKMEPTYNFNNINLDGQNFGAVGMKFTFTF